MDWQGEAGRLIGEVHKSLPDNATLAERKKACREAGGYHYHGGTSWGKKVWAKHTRRYLEKFGLPPLVKSHSPGSEGLFPPPRIGGSNA